ncbi:hypothetical protein QBC46DRAFT_276465 [Diplogelasinospora grovesii]|uniref:Uncharacterized protein n=1 Tax=Diplogelasinospora grovesii TaxID=303347 RepID=A0AAN6NH90_9PEZI|nr:hypothetical protein QBC46DRAFT_276465 [Diplogelasinospora grovesii]
MHDNRSHPLLEQVPLTVSPFVQLPQATTLPYTYKTMPSALPPSATGITAIDPSSGDASAPSANKPKYVVSTSGHAAHPDDIIASCRALQAHINKLQADADAELRALEERIRARELAEKRRLAPGWLDSDARLLEPERKGGDMSVSSLLSSDEHPAGGNARSASQQTQQIGSGHGPGGASEMAVPDEGEELDRAFGAMSMRKC